MIDDEPEDLEPVDTRIPPGFFAAPPRAQAGPDGEPAAPGPPSWLSRGVVVVAILMLLAGLGGYAVTAHLQSGTDFGHSDATGPVPATPTDPDQNVLRNLVVRERDITADYSIELLQGGDQYAGETTLDLCNGTFPSEALRTARFQVAVLNDTLASVMSTEGVLYKNPASAAQAFRELTSVKQHCPTTPVASHVGEDTRTTKFLAAPDATWPAVPGVVRQAYSFDNIDATGTSQHIVTVYLHRGRAFLGLYFNDPDGAQPPIQGKTTVKAITALFEARLAALPAAVVNRG